MVLFRAAAYAFIFSSASALVFLTAASHKDILQEVGSRASLLVVLLSVSYIWLIFVLLFRGVSRKFGPGAFWNWIRGYYYTPKEEERIFMFLDMRSSTMLAEKLGDMKFSKLVRDFFEDLTGPIVETRAEVSHYVGDEAVLTWWPRKGLPEARCIQCFFRMQLVIAKRSDYYMKEYGVVPEFKAGAHIGRVVATEVGSIKSEIVFHGDVLNTTARVQNACSEFDADFLLTEALASRLPKAAWLELQPIGAVALKGKSEKVQLLAARANVK
jgi:adenylate cyclase